MEIYIFPKKNSKVLYVLLREIYPFLAKGCSQKGRNSKMVILSNEENAFICKLDCIKNSSYDTIILCATSLITLTVMIKVWLDSFTNP